MIQNKFRLLGRKTQKSAAFLFVFVLGLLSIIATGGDGGDGGEPGTLQFSSNTYNATEGTDPTVTISVTRVGGSKGAASVDYTTSDDSATQPSDYALTTGTLNWGDGDAATKTFTVAIADDNLTEPSQSFNITLSSPQTASLGTPSTATVSITDDDVAGTLQFSSATYSVTEGTDPTVTITVTRTNGSSGAVSVDYLTSNGTAEQPGDYILTSGTLNWVNGEIIDKTFTIPIVDDSDVELVEAFNVSLNNVVNATLGATSSATVTIYNDDLIPITGTVSAPGGTLAFNEPGLIQRMFAALFGKSVNAAISDLVSPVADATVSIYEVNASGNLVGAAIDTTTTDVTGAFTLTAPADAFDSVKYIVRASGTTEKIDSRITSGTLNVDPSTDATSRMAAFVASNLNDLTRQEVIEMQVEIEELVTDIDTAGANATALSDLLYNETNSRVGRLNVLRSKVSAGQICGNVQTAGGSTLEGIIILVRDYDDFTTRARTYTDASGDYCVNVPILSDTDPDGGTFSGEYIIGAINSTDDSVDPARSASEWLGSGTTYTRYEASKISVPTGTSVSGVDFSLELGARITGTVRASGSLAAVEGVQVDIRDFDSRSRLATARVAQDGTYSVNVIPGTYLIMARNRTMAPYATEVYDAASGTNNRNLGTPVSANVGDQLTINFELEAGSLLDGTVNDGAPVLGSRVRINIADNATSESVDTDRNGAYNIWLRPGSYDVYVYGQRSMAVDLSASATVNFSGSVSTISGNLVDSTPNPVGHATVRLYDSIGGLLSYGSSDGNGIFTAYTDQLGNHLLEVRITRDSDVGSIIYINKTQLLSGDPINIASVGVTENLGPVSLLDGGMLKGTVYVDSSGSTTTPWANFRVQVRDGDTQLANRFLQIRTRGDGSYRVALPAGTYDRVKMRDATDAATGNGNCDNVAIVTGATTVVDFYDGDNTCVIQ